MSTLTSRKSRTAVRAALAVAAGGAALSAVALAGPAANAVQGDFKQLSPGQTFCVQQYASYQARGDGWSNKGAVFSLRRNGVAINTSPIRATAWAAEARTAYGTFPGAGYYQACATNTGTTMVTVGVTITTDAEL